MINAPGGVNGRKVNLTPYDLRKSVHSELEFSTYDPGCGTKEGSMKASKFTEAQIAFVLKQAQDGAPVADVFVARRASRMQPSTTDGRSMPG